jgi:hypothetical protein
MTSVTKWNIGHKLNSTVLNWGFVIIWHPTLLYLLKITKKHTNKKRKQTNTQKHKQTNKNTNKQTKTKSKTKAKSNGENKWKCKLQMTDITRGEIYVVHVSVNSRYWKNCPITQGLQLCHRGILQMYASMYRFHREIWYFHLVYIYALV